MRIKPGRFLLGCAKNSSQKNSFQPSNQQFAGPIGTSKRFSQFIGDETPGQVGTRKVYQGVVTLPPEIIEMIDFIFWWSKEPETYRAPLES